MDEIDRREQQTDVERLLLSVRLCDEPQKSRWFHSSIVFCRSANYNNATGDCELSNMDRITLAGTNAFQVSAPQISKFCLESPKFSNEHYIFFSISKFFEIFVLQSFICFLTLPTFQAADGIDYIENNCVDEPTKLCEFKKLSGRILKTVDSVYQDVGSVDECRELCLNSPYRCHSYDYGDTGEMVCRLSHHSRATLTDIQVSWSLMTKKIFPKLVGD